jgi:hypothetical protein
MCQFCLFESYGLDTGISYTHTMYVTLVYFIIVVSIKYKFLTFGSETSESNAKIQYDIHVWTPKKTKKPFETISPLKYVAKSLGVKVVPILDVQYWIACINDSKMWYHWKWRGAQTLEKGHFSTSKTMKKGNIVIFSYLILKMSLSELRICCQRTKSV